MDAVSENSDYQDPEHEYVILDEDYTYMDETSELSTPSTPTTDNGSIMDDNFVLDQTALKFARDFVISNFNTELEESTIDWLSDIETEKSLETVSESIEVDIEVEEKSKLKQGNKCVLIDCVDGRIERCKKDAAKPLRQLMGIWELYGEAVDVALQEDSAKALTNLGVCSHHFNTDQNQLHRRGSNTGRNKKYQPKIKDISPIRK